MGAVMLHNYISLKLQNRHRRFYVKIKLLLCFCIAALAAACSFSTANMSALKVSKDKEAKQETSTFKAGETIYANAVISNSMGKTTTKFTLKDDKDTVIPGSEVKVDLASSGTAIYSLPIPTGVKGGKYTLTADMLDEKGEKKDGKTASITIEASPASSAPPAATDEDSDADTDAGHNSNTSHDK
jgi:hypothetical protein